MGWLIENGNRSINWLFILWRAKRNEGDCDKRLIRNKELLKISICYCMINLMARIKAANAGPSRLRVNVNHIDARVSTIALPT
jgi:hypothetical protein